MVAVVFEVLRYSWMVEVVSPWLTDCTILMLEAGHRGISIAARLGLLLHCFAFLVVQVSQGLSLPRTKVFLNPSRQRAL